MNSKYKSNEHLITLAAVGDIGLIRNVRLKMRTYGYTFPFRHVKEHFKIADLVFGNLEMPFSNKPTKRSGLHSSEFWADPEAAFCLKHAGFSVMSFANNHTLERGAEGLNTTLSILETLNIKAVGAGENLDNARRLVAEKVKGIKIGFLAYAKTDFAATNDKAGAVPIVREIMVEDIKSAREAVDVLVVSLHFGMIYVDYPNDEGIELCHYLIDQGADIILGHHPHVLQGIEEYNGGIIAYSLGEFIFDPEGGLWYSEIGRETRKESMVLTVRLNKNGYRDYSVIPTMMNSDYQPEVPGEPEKARILNRINGLSESIKTLSSGQFYEYAGSQLVKYELNAFKYHLKRLNILFFFDKISRIRWKHVRLLFGYFRKVIRER